MEEQNALGDDYKIINDKTDAAGVRHITAAPSALVCSKQIDFDIVDGKIRNLKYLRLRWQDPQSQVLARLRRQPSGYRKASRGNAC